jgi:hypothetical protein
MTTNQSTSSLLRAAENDELTRDEIVEALTKWCRAEAAQDYAFLRGAASAFDLYGALARQLLSSYQSSHGWSDVYRALHDDRYWLAGDAGRDPESRLDPILDLAELSLVAARRSRSVEQREQLASVVIAFMQLFLREQGKARGSSGGEGSGKSPRHHAFVKLSEDRSPEEAVGHWQRMLEERRRTRHRKGSKARGTDDALRRLLQTVCDEMDEPRTDAPSTDTRQRCLQVIRSGPMLLSELQWSLKMMIW